MLTEGASIKHIEAKRFKLISSAQYCGSKVPLEGCQV